MLFFVSLRTSSSITSPRSPHQEPRRRVHWDSDVSSKDLRTKPAKLSFLTQPSNTISPSVPYTGEFDSDEENVILISSADHLNTNYEATSVSNNSSEPTYQN